VIPYGKHDIDQTDIDVVTQILKNEFLTQGKVVPEFEKRVSEYCGAKHGVATNSATSALHIACLALGLSEGDYLWTSPNTFVASANCGLYCGAKIDFVDIDPKTYNISPDSLEEKLIYAKKNGQLPKIIVPVHFSGQSCEMKAIHKLSLQYGFKILEDASHAIGGEYRNKAIGSCQYSDITVFSFHPVKIITTGEGGMAVTNDDLLSKKMSMLRSHGITHDNNLMTQNSDGQWFYQQIDLGFNYRLTDIQAALGISQINRLEHYVEKRHKIALNYNKAFKELPLKTPYQHSDTKSSFHLYVIQLIENKQTLSKKDLFDRLRKLGIGVNLHYIPVHTQPYFKKFGFKLGDFPVAEKYYKNVISIPMYPTLQENQQNFVISSIKKILN
tara:strand:+ start:327 stop:1484 length:1158 start_codon:yes stop_codon:yes gene_type:complete